MVTTAAGIATLAALLLPSAAAGAVAVTGPSTCASPLNPIAISVSGLTPGQQVAVGFVKSMTAGAEPVSAVADEFSNANAQIVDWITGDHWAVLGGRPAKLSVKDAGGLELATSEIRTTLANVRVDRAGAYDGRDQPYRWQIGGLAEKGAVYRAYYLRGNRVVKSVTLGTAADDCGYLEVKRRLTPLGLKRGWYGLVVQPTAVFDPARKGQPYRYGRVHTPSKSYDGPSGGGSR